MHYHTQKQKKNKNYLRLQTKYNISMDLSHGMKALWRIEMFNLMMLMSCFIAQVFCQIKGVFDLNNMTHFIKTFLWPLHYLMGFDCSSI